VILDNLDDAGALELFSLSSLALQLAGDDALLGLIGRERALVCEPIGELAFLRRGANLGLDGTRERFLVASYGSRAILLRNLCLEGRDATLQPLGA
jgi:hypothetical protein